MSDAIDVTPADRAARLIRSALLAALLASILFISYGLAVPRRRPGPSGIYRSAS